MATQYIPTSDLALSAWLDNFATLIAANPTSFGLLASDATAITAQSNAFGSALSLATDPSTRTPSTIAAKDAAKATALAVVRPYAQRINLTPAVSDEQRAALGITIRKTVPTPVPAPASAPALSIQMAIPGVATLGYKDPASPSGKAKPYGVTGVEVRTSAGTVASSNPDTAQPRFMATKSPFQLPVTGTDVGKVITVFARFSTRSGPSGIAQVGPWSSPLTFVGM